jgi:hypothetical protein
MPDPMAAKRLLDYGCKVRYERTHLLEPREVKTHEDLRPGTQKGKLDRNPVWVVEITMPRKLVSDIFEGHMTKMRESIGIGSTEGKQAAPAEEADEMTAQSGMGAAAAGAAPAGGMPAAPGV